MAFFCTSSGARIIAPGIAVSAGGTIPDHDGSPAADEAEQAAAAALAAEIRGAGTPPSPGAVAAASGAAALVVANADPDAPPPEGSLARLWFDRAHAVRDALDEARGRISALVDDLAAADADRESLRAQIAALTAPPKPTTTPPVVEPEPEKKATEKSTPAKPAAPKP